MKKILLFTGAGMSVPMGLPSAEGFAETIKKCEPNLFNLLKGLMSDDVNDIEKILYVLEEFINGSRFYRHLITSYSPHAQHTPFTNVAQGMENHAKRFQQTVKHDIFSLLQKFDPKKALNIYLNLFKTLKELYKEDVSISIFTTNYDLIFEDIVFENTSSFNKLGYNDFYFGFRTKYGKMRFDESEDFKWSTEIIEYNKLHGSLDWTKDNRGIVVKAGAITMPAVPDDMPLLYPGYKGTPTDEPFISIHNKLYLRLIECDEVYVVGFAFRDPYINSIFEFALRAKPQLNINCYNPCAIDALPAESNIPYLSDNRSNQFFYYQRGISDTNDPLGLLS